MAATQYIGSPFIIETGGQVADPEARKRIRRHVMLGKNKGKRRQSQPRKLTSTAVAADMDISSSGVAIGLRRAAAPKLYAAAGNGLSFIHFADSVDLAMIADLMYFTSFAKKALFPLEPCTNFSHKSDWLEAVTTDAALLHTMIFSTQDYFAQAAQGKSVIANHAGSVHSLKAIELLRKRLESDGDQSKVSDATLMVVLALAMHAQMVGEEAIAREHMMGLRKIIDVRGGIATFRDNPKLLHEVLRSDLNMALDSGRTSLFFSGNQREQFWPFPTFEKKAPNHSLAAMVNFTDSDDLNAIWDVMRAFAARSKHATKAGARLSVEMLLNMVASTTYRLLHLQFDQVSTNEVIRLCLLAFCSRVFLQLRDFKSQHTYLRQRYRSCLLDLQHTSKVSCQLWVWLLFVGGTSLFNELDHHWLLPVLREALTEAQLASWTETKDVLTTFVWIDLVLDKPAQDLFDICVTSEQPP